MKFLSVAALHLWKALKDNCKAVHFSTVVEPPTCSFTKNWTSAQEFFNFLTSSTETHTAQMPR